MRIALISDIHGNLPALKAVMDDIGQRNVEAIFNLGDIVAGPLWPAETADFLMALDLPTIAGNHETQMCNLPDARKNRSDKYASAQMLPHHWDWLASLPMVLSRGDFYAKHATPTHDLDYFLDTVTKAGLRQASDKEILARCGGVDQTLVACGHSHMPRVISIGARLFVNPGSVGLPAYRDDAPFDHVVELCAPNASYAIVTAPERINQGGLAGPWDGELIQVAYDHMAAARQAAKNGRPDWAYALETGFAPNKT